MSALARGDRIALRIEKWVQNGFCLAHDAAGRPVFVHAALPGEEVQALILKAVEGHSFARAEKILQPSPLRIDSDCSAHPECGGCSYRHLSREAELELKARLLEEFPALQECFAEAPPESFVGPERGFRNHVQLHASENGPGFFALFSNDVVPFPPTGCAHIPDQLGAHIAAHPPDGKRVTYRFARNIALGPLHPRSPAIQERIHLPGEAEFDFVFPALGFFQTNRFLVEAWLIYLRSRAARNTETTIELFCGAGLIGAALRDQLGQYRGFESSAESVAAARNNATRLQWPARFSVVDLWRHPVATDGVDLLIANPPRAGLGRGQLQAIIAAPPRQLIYSSCNAQTLDRDLRRLRDCGFRCAASAWFDFFPRTPHLELVVDLRFRD